MNNITSAINVNVDAEIKEKATAILKDLGLNMSTFINMALTQVVKRNGIPFKVTNPEPSLELIEALREADDIANGKVDSKRYRDIEQMFKDALNEVEDTKC